VGSAKSRTTPLRLEQWHSTGALTPSLQVTDDAISDDSPATVEYRLQNRSLQSIEFSTRPDPSRLLGVGYSTENEAVLSRPNYTVRSVSEGSDPCWRAETMVTLEDQMHYIWSIFPWVPRSRECHLAAPSRGGCLSPVTYRFETAYVVNESGMDDVE
jgi:hypothetical protein